MIVIAGTATIHSERWNEAVQRAQQMSGASEAESGCISYRVYVNPTERNAFFIFEQWENAEALTKHFQTSHFQEFGVYLSSILDGDINIQRYEVSSVGPLM